MAMPTSERRRFTRIKAAVPVLLVRKQGVEALLTANLSRYGAFIRTDAPCDVGSMVHLRFIPPGEPEFDVVCRVVRARSDKSPGMGVDFFSLSREAKDGWRDYVESMARRIQKEGALDDDRNLLAPIRRAHPRTEACYMVRFSNADAVQAFMSKDISAGGIRLEGKIEQDIGSPLMIAIVHPNSEEEFELHATLARVEYSPPAFALAFSDLSAEKRAQLRQFLATGAHIFDDESASLQNARRRARANPDDPSALEILGRAQLRNGDAASAIDSLTKALVLAPSMTTLHEKLSEAYYLVGDQARARGHERVALSLNLYRSEVENAIG